MPRGRGGVRTGTPGTSYGNRTDLQASAGKPLPVATPPSTQYGQAAASQRSQQAVPLAPQTAAAPAQQPPGPPGAPPGDASPGAIPPGGFGDLLRPTERPGEPVTTGLPVGPGAGPEALTMNQPQFTITPQLQAIGFLNSLKSSLPPELRGVLASLQAAQGNNT